MAKNLVIYFSESGNTEKLANLIHEQVGGDIARLEPAVAYPKTSYEDLADYAKNEHDSNARPEYNLSVNPADYDNIFVGYPMWWYTLPMIMYKFFEDYDFSGKTLVPFNTHEGSYDGGTWDTIKSWEPNAKILDGIAVRGGDLSNPASQADTVKNWLEGIGF